MNPKDAYKLWSQQYDTDENKTRDLEAIALRTMLADMRFESCLELGCGTGKNTEWLVNRADQVLAVDFSEEMLSKAREKVKSSRVEFIQADITQPWTFVDKNIDLVSFSLVLEHIEDLDSMFTKVSKVLAPKGHVYVGELHPFKQYSGSKARFETEDGLQIVTCYTHHISEFVTAAKKNELSVVYIKEFFDNDEKKDFPRVIGFLFRNELGISRNTF